MSEIPVFKMVSFLNDNPRITLIFETVDKARFNEEVEKRRKSVKDIDATILVYKDNKLSLLYTTGTSILFQRFIEPIMF